MNRSQLIKDIQEKAVSIRRCVIQMAADGKTSHVGSALSCVDLICALYFHYLKIDPQQWDDPKFDRFILSKGHGAKAWFAALALRGFFPFDKLKEYARDGSYLGEHPTHGFVPGIKLSTGSLGHGLSVGAGMAIAKKLNRNFSRVFVMLSDGECNEGSVWEGAMYAAHQKLDNLIAIVDHNDMQAMGHSSEVNALEPLADKWKAFGWQVREIDGHNISEIVKTLQKLPFQKKQPSVIIAHTLLGKGVSFMENKLRWHYQVPFEEHVKKAMQELAVPNQRDKKEKNKK